MSYLRFAFGAGAFAAALVSAGAVLAGPFDSENLLTDRQLSSYESVYIAPVKVELDHHVVRYDRSGYGDRPVDPDDANRKAADFHDELVDAFSESYSLAPAPGPGVLTLEATLTKLQSSRPTPADYDRETSLSFESVYAGGGSMTAVFSEDGEVLAELGDEFNSYLSDGRVRAGIWQDVDRAFSQWAKKLVKYTQKN